MDTCRFSGHKLQVIWVTVGPLPISTAALTVMAHSRYDITCNPGEVAFGDEIAGQTPSATADFEYAGKLAWRISDVIVPKNAPFEAAVSELYRGPGEVGYRLKVTLKKDATPGHFQETILLKTNDPEAKLIAVPVSGTIKSVWR